MKTSKRLKWLAPLLGTAVLAASGVLPAKALAKEDNRAIASAEFIGMPAPATPEDMARAYTEASLKVTYRNGAVQTFPLTYKTLFKSTDVINGTPAGLAVDRSGQPIMDYSVPDHPVPFVSDGPDANSLMSIKGAAPTGHGGNPLSLVTHYEYITSDNAGKSAYGLVPASMSLSTIDQNKKTGELSVTDVNKIDFSEVDGLWIPCNGSLTPWNTHLGSEEYDPDARAFEKDPSQTYVGAFAKAYDQDDKKTGNPYAYGYIPEVTVHADNTTSVVKHYSMGRFSHELGVVAPDRRTVLFGDDGGNTMMFLYVADRAEDLSEGTLYAAKWIQTEAKNGGAADLQWIRLGHASDSEIKTYIDQGLTFSDLFETADKDTPGFTRIKTYPSGKSEWLKVKPGMEQAAAFLEARRYGAILGATSEFNKMEGLAVNQKDKKAYVAISYLEKGMEKDAKGEDPADDIRLDKLKAGATYELAMHGGQEDVEGKAIASEYVPGAMKALVVGEDLAQPDDKGNTAAVDKVANPDNLAYSESLRTLFIGEDSGMHANNFLWAYQVDTGKLSRILSVPAGAEATGLQMVDDLNGFSYIMSNLQHPGDEMILPDGLKQQVEGYIDQIWDNKKAGSVGYISGLPSVSRIKGEAGAGGENAPGKRNIPLRDAAEALGARVEWNQEEQSATVTLGGRTLVVTIGQTAVRLNGQTVELEEAAELVDERTFIPAGLLEELELAGRE